MIFCLFLYIFCNLKSVIFTFNSRIKAGSKRNGGNEIGKLYTTVYMHMNRSTYNMTIYFCIYYINECTSKKMCNLLNMHLSINKGIYFYKYLSTLI